MIREHWILGCLVLLLIGCKTPPAAEAPPFIPLELLDAGEEPRSLLRYAIAEGTTTTSKMSWRVIPSEHGSPTTTVSGLQKMEIHAVIGPAKVDEQEIRYDFEIVESKAVAGPGASEKLLEDIQVHTDFLKGTGSWNAMDDSGHVRGLRYNQKAVDVPLRLLWTITNAFSLVSVVALPNEEVGVGARWAVRGMLALHGVKMVQEAIYTLVERDGDQVVLDVEFARSGNRQIVEFAEDESSLEVESGQTIATGHIRLDLRTLGSHGTATGRIKNKVVFVEEGHREHAEIDESFDFRIESATTVPAN
ncbi:MAG: hypothetical protein OES21_12575 [Myxococcales bacterium]|jgi:hypothetical protein|nr:hypothetical protein [Myxococcales bacterium]